MKGKNKGEVKPVPYLWESGLDRAITRRPSRRKVLWHGFCIWNRTLSIDWKYLQSGCQNTTPQIGQNQDDHFIDSIGIVLLVSREQAGLSTFRRLISF